MLRLRSRERGQSVIEFGILALLFALMMFAIVEFGLLLNGWVSVSSTTREAARWASTGLKVAGSVNVMTGVYEDGIYDKVLHGQSPPGVSPADQRVEVTYETTSSPSTWWTCTAAQLIPPYLACTRPGFASVPADSFPDSTVIPGTPVKVKVTAEHYEVITPLVRPIFGCDGTVVNCYVAIPSWNTMYYEGLR